MAKQKKQNWPILFLKKAEKEFSKLDKSTQLQIYKALKNKLQKDPENYLERLSADKKDFYKFRVGNYRLICHKDNKK